MWEQFGKRTTSTIIKCDLIGPESGFKGHWTSLPRSWSCSSATFSASGLPSQLHPFNVNAVCASGAATEQSVSWCNCSQVQCQVLSSPLCLGGYSCISFVQLNSHKLWRKTAQTEFCQPISLIFRNNLSERVRKWDTRFPSFVLHKVWRERKWCGSQPTKHKVVRKKQPESCRSASVHVV